MAPRSVPVILEFESGYPASTGIAVVVDRNLPGRLARALSATALCFGFALVCIFVPLAHFVLVPSLLVTGVVLGIMRLREETSLVELHGTCPRCKQEKVFPAGGRFGPKRSLRCNQCAEKISLAPAGSLDGG